MEFSKKIMIFVGILFALITLTCAGIFVYCTINGMDFDWTGITTLLTVVGAAFTVTTAVYSTKAKWENIYKIKKSFLQEKYDILNKCGLLTQDLAHQEIFNELDTIESKLTEFEYEASTDDGNESSINLYE